MSYENKILQMKKLLGKATPMSQEKPKFLKPEAPLYSEHWTEQGLTRIDNDYGVLFERVIEYPFHTQHGNYRLNELFEVLTEWEEYDDHPFKMTEDEQIVFFDTETTGLKGTGTHIFLLGFLTIEPTCFKLTQYVLADPSNEVALLFESKLWQGGKTFVSYNGKSFDWPMVETRWTLNRQHLPPLKSPRQIDLLHSTKRLWKNDLQQMKLTKVEQQKLGFMRQGDIPGFLAPVIYLDAVKSGEAGSLMKVLHHNEWDLLSLITLYIHSSKLLFDQQLQESATTFTNIGKWHQHTKHLAASEKVLNHVITNFEEDEAATAQYILAFELKKQQKYESSASAFLRALSYLPLREQLNSYEQLAIIYEHKIKDLQQAYKMTIRGLEMIDTMNEWREGQQQKWLEKFTARSIRLAKKLERIEQEKVK